MALDDIKKLRALGFGINFFYPKWAHGNHWQAYLLEEPPVPGGWKALAKLASDAHQLDCRVQCFIFENNASRMRYHEYLRRGYPIATGIIEGACRHLVKDRMERSGMRWSITGAQAMLHVRAIHQSADLSDFHEQRICTEQTTRDPYRSLITTYQPCAA